MREFFLVIGMLFSLNAFAIQQGDLVVISDTGQQYGSIESMFFSDYKHSKERRKLTPEHELQRLKKMSSSSSYKPVKGDIGKVVYIFDEGSIAVVDVAGNPIIMGLSGLAISNKTELSKFNKRVSERDEFLFLGFNLDGKTSYDETLTNLDKKNIKYTKFWMYGSSELAVLKLHNYPKAPVINGLPVSEFYLYFYRNQLYEIEVNWEPKSYTPSDIRELESYKLKGSLTEALANKYRNNYGKQKGLDVFRYNSIEDGEYLDITHKLWITNNKHITLRYLLKSFGLVSGYYLQYTNSTIEPRALKLSEIAKAEKAKREKDNRLKNNQDAL